MTKLTLGYSPCPNDTYIFHALSAGLVDPSPDFDICLADVEELNRRALFADLDVCKVSVGALGSMLGEYALLRSGAALGRGVGPILVADREMEPADLAGLSVGIPGRNTTANLLLGLLARELDLSVNRVEMRFDEIMPAVASGALDAGLVIHEGRFTYGQAGLLMIADLGEWWEMNFGLPLPLGGIAIRRSLGPDAARQVELAIRKSLETANSDPSASRPYIKEHAQEMDDAVIDEHIRTFVTEFSLDLGPEGEQAVVRLVKESLDMDENQPFALDVFATKG